MLKPVLLWSALIAVVMLPRLLNLDLFVGPDELAELGRNNNFALALARGDLPGTLVGDGKPSVTLMWINTLGVTGQWLWGQLSGSPRPFEQVVAPERPFSVWPERRLFLALGSGLQILAAWPLLRRLWSEQIATVAVGLMGLEPLLLAFTRMIRGDALLAGFMILSLLGALAFLKTGQQRYNWLSGVMAGLAGLTKLSGGAIVITVALLYGVALLKKDENLTSSFILWLLAAAVAFFGLWPAWWFRPRETFDLLWNKGLFHAVEATSGQADLYFWGAVHPAGPGPWFYPVLAGLRLTPWLILGGLIALGRWLWSTLRGRAPLDLNLVGLLLYLGVYGLVITLPGQKLDRFFTPMIPALTVLTAIEIAHIIQWLSESTSRRLKPTRTSHLAPRLLYLSLTFIALALVWHISRYHPLYSTYFNPLSGTPQFWAWALPIGHGEGVNSALLYLAGQGDMSQKTLLCGTNLPRCEPFFNGTLLPQEDLRSGAWFKADYVLWHVDEEQMEVFPAEVLAYLRRQPQLYVAHYHGLDYSWLYAVPQPAFLASKARLEGVARLFGYDAGGQDLSRLAAGDTIKLHVYWQNEGQAHQQQFWWRVVDHSGYVWSEAVTRPLPDFEAEAVKKGAVVEGTVNLPLPPDLPPGPYALQAGFANKTEEVGQFPLPAAGSELTVGGVPAGPTQPGQQVNYLIAPGLRLRGYDLSSREATPGDLLWLTLYWQGVEEMPQDYTLALRLLDPSGQVIKGWEFPPVSAVYPTSTWAANSYVRGPHLLSLPTELAPGQYEFDLTLAGAAKSVKLGMVNFVTRKAVFDLPPVQFSAHAVFGDIATLLGYDLAGTLSPEGARVAVTLYWQAQKKTTRPYQVKLRLVDGSSGSLLAEQTAEPGQGVAPTSEWQTGEIITDRHELIIASSQPTSVNLEIQLLADTLQPVTLAQGQPLLVVPEVQQKVSWRTQ
ncbi:MAG: glycosyltransferase family 39 protein [Anaerolineae bacterium]|nr:glycosyltransferase family 39 protein [Anaerolineae bacterium]